MAAPRARGSPAAALRPTVRRREREIGKRGGRPLLPLASPTRRRPRAQGLAGCRGRSSESYPGAGGALPSPLLRISQPGRRGVGAWQPCRLRKWNVSVHKTMQSFTHSMNKFFTNTKEFSNLDSEAMYRQWAPRWLGSVVEASNWRNLGCKNRRVTRPRSFLVPLFL